MNHENRSYIDHADCGVYSTGVVIETSDEETYRNARKLLLNLIDEIDKSDIPVDQKQRIIDGLKAIRENPFVVASFIEVFKAGLGLG